MAKYKASTVMFLVDDIATELHQRDRLVRKLCEAGLPHETVEETLDRLLLERKAVCELLNQSGAIKFDYPEFHHSFDTMVSRFLKPSKKDLRRKT